MHSLRYLRFFINFYPPGSQSQSVSHNYKPKETLLQILPSSTNHERQRSSWRTRRGAVHVSRSFYWDRGIIQYTLSPSFYTGKSSTFMRERIESAMWEIEFNSCVRFVERTEHVASTSSIRDFVMLIDDAEHCYSDIGRQGGTQIAAVGRGCATRGGVLHELLHTVGMWHTTSRIDRDQHVFILWDNLNVSRIITSLVCH